MEDHYQLAGLSFLLGFSVEGDLLLTSEELFDPAGLLANNWLKKSASTFWSCAWGVGLPDASPCSLK